MTFLGPIQLDGTTGSLTQDLVGPLGSITEYHDIAAVYRDGSNRKLRELPQSINPLTQMNGLSTLYIAPDYTTPASTVQGVSSKQLRHVSVVVWARQRPRTPLWP